MKNLLFTIQFELDTRNAILGNVEQVSDNRKNWHDYEICHELWNKIKPLLLLPNPKKKSGRPKKDDRKIISGKNNQ